MTEDEYAEHFKRVVLPKIDDSAVGMSIIAPSDTERLDFKQCAEIGAMLLLDKPLILVCTPGATIPSRLRHAADIVIDNWQPDDTDAQERVEAAIRWLVPELEL